MLAASKASKRGALFLLLFPCINIQSSDTSLFCCLSFMQTSEVFMHLCLGVEIGSGGFDLMHLHHPVQA